MLDLAKLVSSHFKVKFRPNLVCIRLQLIGCLHILTKVCMVMHFQFPVICSVFVSI